jgi:hypothetical protein
MEFNYLPLSALVTAPDTYDWTRLEKLLNDIAGRGHQTVFRIYVEYPGKKDGIPDFLINDGLKVYRYRDNISIPPADNITPDYENPKLRTVLIRFIAALGKRYDGDARVGFITAGLLGHWGEWHTYPRDDLFAKKAVQNEVMDAYEAAFHTTPILLRYPAGDNDYAHAPNARRRFGYHDDSFAWATLATGRKADDWFYMAALEAAGPPAREKWKTQPIGGEIRPEAWGKVFDQDPGMKEIQDFHKCVQETHASWLLDTGMFRRVPGDDRKRRAEAEVRMMGYEFHIRTVSIGQCLNGKLPLTLEVENRGVAPFYYKWPVEYAILSEGKILKTRLGSANLTGLLPDERAKTWEETVDTTGISPGNYHLAVRVANPLKGGKPLRFANQYDDADSAGWLKLAEFPIR